MDKLAAFTFALRLVLVAGMLCRVFIAKNQGYLASVQGNVFTLEIHQVICCGFLGSCDHSFVQLDRGRAVCLNVGGPHRDVASRSTAFFQ